MTARATWKAYELRCAKDLGGMRIPVTGVDRHGADVVTPLFAVQVKLRKALPGWLFDWLSGIRSTAKRQCRIGILVLRKPRQRDEDALVVMSMADFIDLHGAVKPCAAFECYPEAGHSPYIGCARCGRPEDEHAA